MVWAARFPAWPIESLGAAMVDVFSTTKRSEVMKCIRSQGNKTTERTMTAMLRANGISGWKLHPPEIIGRPDIYFPRKKLALFLDGCFWHACKKCFQMPKQNRVFWEKKIMENVKRDRRINRKLRRNGISVTRIWEHDLKSRTPRLKSLVEALCHRANCT